MPTPSSTTTLLSAAYNLTQALLQPRESSPLPPIVVSQTRALLELANIFKQSLILPTTGGTDTIIKDDDENLLENEVSPTTETILPSNIQNNISTIDNLYDEATVQTTNNNEHTLDNTTDPPSLDIITTNINTSLPRVPHSQDNICLPRVADRTSNNNNNTYKHLTRNPGKRRRTAKKKRLSRESFPRPNLERIDEETITLSPPIPQKITEITTPSSEIITTITTPTTTPTPTPTPSPTSNTNNKSNVGEIGYKFKNSPQVMGTSKVRLSQ